MQREKIDIQEGLSSYLSKLTQAPLLSAEEEVELTRLSQQGDCAARQRIVEVNMRLVISIARAYRSKAVPLEDLIQEGAIGLMHAVERFDPEKGFRFSTYATHWVRQSIGRALDNKAKAIRIPAHISQTLRKIEREKAKLTRDLGGEPSQEELALAMGITPRKLSALYQCAREMVSLDTKIGENDNTTLGGLLRTEDQSTNPEAEAINGEMQRELYHILMELSERERHVVSFRLKMDDTPENEIRDELAKELQLSRERIRQIEMQAIKKLRAVAQKRRFREMLTG